MKQTRTVAMVLMTSIFFFSSCRYDNYVAPSTNIILHDKPIDVIKANIQGQWKFLYEQGGISGGTFTAKNNPYMTITGDHIVTGNDLGVTLDTIIVWKRDVDIFNEYTFLLSYRYSKGYAFPYYKIVDRIKNDTLILIDNTSDPFYYSYLRIKSP